MNEIQSFSRKSAFWGTLFFWICLAIILLIIPQVPSHPVYKTIRIQIAPAEAVTVPAVVRTSQSASSTASTASVPSAKVEASVKPVREKVVQHTIEKSIDERMAENAVQKKKQPVWDEHAFSADNSDVNVSSSSVPASRSNPAGKKVPELEGVSASVSEPTGSTVTAASSRNSSGGYSRTETTAALDSIISTAAGSSSSGAGSASGHSSSVVYDGSGSAVTINTGSGRSLRRPSKPAITLSAAAAAKIDSDKKVSVSFIVLANGTVPATGITIEPKSILPAEVYREIVDQISLWLFEEAPDQGTASFSYVIKKN